MGKKRKKEKKADIIYIWVTNFHDYSSEHQAFKKEKNNHPKLSALQQNFLLLPTLLFISVSHIHLVEL